MYKIYTHRMRDVYMVYGIYNIHKKKDNIYVYIYIYIRVSKIEEREVCVIQKYESCSLTGRNQKSRTASVLFMRRVRPSS